MTSEKKELCNRIFSICNHHLLGYTPLYKTSKTSVHLKPNQMYFEEVTKLRTHCCCLCFCDTCPSLAAQGYWQGVLLLYFTGSVFISHSVLKDSFSGSRLFGRFFFSPRYFRCDSAVSDLHIGFLFAFFKKIEL